MSPGTRQTAKAAELNDLTHVTPSLAPQASSAKPGTRNQRGA
jgi:hypothetical protein